MECFVNDIFTHKNYM